MNRLESRVAKLERGGDPDHITVVWRCPKCSEWTTDTRSPCGQHPPEPPGERKTISIERSYLEPIGVQWEND